MLEVNETGLTGVLEVRPRWLGDARGAFAEVWNARRFAEHGIAAVFVQDNQSVSRYGGTVRGLHFQRPPHAQAKLVRAVAGSAYDVAVDLRAGSQTYGKYTAVTLDAEVGNQLYIPVGFAHGFCTLAPNTEILYKVSAYYAPDHDAGVRWDDPDIAVPWPVEPGGAVLSEKDRALPGLAEIDPPFAS